MNILNNIKVLCKKHNITILDLEKLMGISQGVLYTWKNSSPNIEKVCKIAKYFNISVDYLVKHKIKENNILHIHNYNDQTIIKKYMSLTDKKYKSSIKNLIDHYANKELNQINYENELRKTINNSDNIKNIFKVVK